MTGPSTNTNLFSDLSAVATLHDRLAVSSSSKLTVPTTLKRASSALEALEEQVPKHKKPDLSCISPLSKRRITPQSTQNLYRLPKIHAFARRLFRDPTPLEHLTFLCKRYIASMVEGRELALARLNLCFKDPQPEHELTLLLYYLERDGMTPQTASNLLNYRIEEMLSLIEDMLKTIPSSTQGIIPTSVSQYLLRTFSRMIISPTGRFFDQGASIIRRILQSRVAVHLRMEHVVYLHHVLEHLSLQPKLYQVEFEKVFSPDFVIHPAVEPLIRLDWQLPADHPITSRYTAWTLVKAILEQAYQCSRLPNCFAVAAVNSVGFSHPHVRLQTLIELLRTAAVKCGPHDLSIERFLLPYLTDPVMLDAVVKSDNLLDSIPIAHICEITQSSPATEDDNPKQLRSCFNEEVRPQAEQLLTAIKQNSLLVLLVLAAQLVTNNAPVSKKLKHTSKKEDVILKLLDLFRRSHLFFDEKKTATLLRKHLFIENIVTRDKPSGDDFQAMLCTHSRIFFLDDAGAVLSNLTLFETI